MGATSSRLLLDWSVEEYTTEQTKHIDYYDGKRFFKVPRELYPQYTRGWLWGYYDN